MGVAAAVLDGHTNVLDVVCVEDGHTTPLVGWADVVDEAVPGVDVYCVVAGGVFCEVLNGS